MYIVKLFSKKVIPIFKATNNNNYTIFTKIIGSKKLYLFTI